MQEIIAQKQANIFSLQNNHVQPNSDYLPEKIIKDYQRITSYDIPEMSLNQENQNEKAINHKQEKDLNSEFHSEKKLNLLGEIQRQNKTFFTLNVENRIDEDNKENHKTNINSHEAQNWPQKNKSFFIINQSNKFYENYQTNQNKQIKLFNYSNRFNKQEKIFVISKIKKPNNWTKDEDKILINLAFLFKQKSWTKVSKEFPNKTPAQCRARFKRIRPGIIKGPWSHDEDMLIISLASKHGKNWALISKSMQTRNGKQIRDRFLNYLDPNINKSRFSKEEDKKVIKYYKEYGPKWSLISQQFAGRTGDIIKNRFHSCLKRKIHLNEVFEAKRKIKRSLCLMKIKNMKKFRTCKNIKAQKKNYYNENLLDCDEIGKEKQTGNYESFDKNSNFIKPSSGNFKTEKDKSLARIQDRKKNENFISKDQEKINFCNDEKKKLISDNKNCRFLDKLKLNLKNKDYENLKNTKNEHLNKNGELYCTNIKDENNFSLNYFINNDHKCLINKKRTTDKVINFQKSDARKKENNFNKDSKIIYNKTAKNFTHLPLNGNNKEIFISEREKIINDDLNLNEDYPPPIGSYMNGMTILPNIIEKDIFDAQKKEKNSSLLSHSKSRIIKDKCKAFNLANITEIINNDYVNMYDNLFEMIVNSLQNVETDFSPLPSETNTSNVNKNIYGNEFLQSQFLKDFIENPTNLNYNISKEETNNGNDHVIKNTNQLITNLMSQNGISNSKNTDQQTNPIQNNNYENQNQNVNDYSITNNENFINYLNRAIYSQLLPKSNTNLNANNQNCKSTHLFYDSNQQTLNTNNFLKLDSEFSKFLINFINHLYYRNRNLNQLCQDASIIKSCNSLQENENLFNINDQFTLFDEKNQTLNTDLYTLNLCNKIVEMQRNFNNINFTYLLMLENVKKSFNDYGSIS